MRLLLPHLQLLDGAPPQLQLLDHLMPSPAGHAPLSAADVPLLTDPTATQLPPASGFVGAKRSIWSEHEAVPSSVSSPPALPLLPAAQVWRQYTAVQEQSQPNVTRSPPGGAVLPHTSPPAPPLAATQERRQQYTVSAPSEEGHSSRQQGERDVAVSSPAAQLVEEADTTRVSEENFGALGGAATGSDRTADEEASRNLQQQQQYTAERDELRADVVHMQEAFGQVQTMVQVRGGEGGGGARWREREVHVRREGRREW